MTARQRKGAGLGARTWRRAGQREELDEALVVDVEIDPAWIETTVAVDDGAIRSLLEKKRTRKRSRCERRRKAIRRKGGRERRRGVLMAAVARRQRLAPGGGWTWRQGGHGRSFAAQGFAAASSWTWEEVAIGDG